MIKLSLLLITFTVALFSSQNTNQDVLNFKKQKTTSTKTYKQSTKDKDSAKWNTSDWSDYAKKNGANTGSIGKMQSFFGTSKRQKTINDANSNNINADNKNTGNSNAWNNKISGDLKRNTSLQSSSLFSLRTSTKCYIARDLPIKYKCSKTGMEYGGLLQSNGYEAHNACLQECFEPKKCLTVKKEEKNYLKFQKMEVSNNKQIIEVSKNINSEYPLSNISISINTTKEYSSKLKIYITKNEKISLIGDFKLNNNKLMIPLNYTAEKITLSLEQTTTNETTKLTDIQISIVHKEKSICPFLQDISFRNSGDFSYVCPSGKISTFTKNGRTYKICQDSGVIGKNKDGTFSTSQECSSVCKKQYECKVNSTSYNFNFLKEVREGCIEGENNCQTDTCSKLRESGAKIINETVFDATGKATVTISKGMLQKNTTRPKPLVSTDLAYENREEQELKNKAYIRMINNKTYATSALKLSEVTQSDSAFAKDDNGKINWLYKPSSSEVNEKKYNFYIILEILADRIKNRELTIKDKNRNRIFYTKINNSDGFKSFAIQEKAYTMTKNSQGRLKKTINNQATLNYKTFSSNSWHYISPNNILESFKTEKLELKDAYVRNVALSYNGVVYRMKNNGLVSSIVNDEKIYNTKTTGTGEVIADYLLYGFIAEKDKRISYEDAINMITTKKIKPFYSFILEKDYSKILRDDSLNFTEQEIGDKFSIQTYLYGRIDNKTGFLKIKPSKEDVAKRGYIFMFAY